MQRKGYIIRFIDIGLIILFGFLMISDLTVLSQIDLPGSEQEPPATPDTRDSRMIGVVIEESGIYRLVEMETGEPLFVNIEAPADLEALVVQLMDEAAAASTQIEIVIEPHPRSIMQRLVNVHDLCERLGIRQNINAQAARAGL